LAAALAGSLGVAPTGNLNPERAAPSMFEPIHGSAFDIMGRRIANPLGSFWSASLMLEHLGEADAAGRLMQAIETVTGEGKVLPRDLGGQASMDDVTGAVREALRS
ncbi:MAG: isocitrate/isopropylmalate family dehydrogenase, partial [Pseudomonadota bacterium]|nr:isocitrate/isopropylmalate family dehydrogenase [Pseudomonadota bacterium]